MMEMASQKQMNTRHTSANIHKVLQLAVPSMMENILQVFLGMTDMYFIARLGTEAVAGVGVTNIFMNVYIAFFTALGIGTTAIVARKMGANEKEDVNKTIFQSLILVLGVGLFLGVLTLFYAEKILALLKMEVKVIEYALPYFYVVSVPSVLLALMLVLSSALRGVGDTKTPLKVTIWINIINVALDYILIFGIFGYDGLGILGAGVATTVSRLVGVILILRFLVKKGYIGHRLAKENLKVDWNIMWRIVKIGFPAALERLFMRFGQLVYGAMIISIGTSAYAAHNIAGTIESLSYMPGFGFAVAASTLVGQSLGEKDFKQAEKFGMLSYWLGTLIMVVIGVLFFIFARPLALLFTHEEIVVEQVVSVLRIIALVQPMLSMTLIIPAALQGAGATIFPMLSTMIGIWMVRVLGVYYLGICLKLGLVGVWLAVAGDLVLRGSILMIWFKIGRWKLVKI